MSDNPHNLSIEDTHLATWFERDRSHVCLSVKDKVGDAGETIVEWWDDAVGQAIEDGFLEPRRLHGSAFEYASQMGLLNPANRTEVKEQPPVGWVILDADRGVLMTWRGGEMVWSANAGPEDVERGAVTFSDENAASTFFDADDLADDDDPDGEEALRRLTFHEMFLDVTPEGHAHARRVSLAALVKEGFDLHMEALPTPA